MIFVYLIPDIYLNIYGNVLDTDILLPQYIVNTLPVVQCLNLIRLVPDWRVRAWV